MDKKTKLVISVVIVLAVALITWCMTYPEQKEPIELGFTDAWPVERADASIEIQNELVEGVPVINFKYNNRSYTTLGGEEGLTVDLKEESFNDLLDCVEHGSISQSHAIASGGRIYAVYTLIDNRQVYFSKEKLIDIDSCFHGITLEKKDEAKTIVCFDQRIVYTIFVTMVFTVIGFIIVFVSLWMKPTNLEISH
ncbi:MAG: hypothetical protein KAI71_02750 [Candidatus Pacebacteria bacterium]|nr:hypothetical protein [Candidatus Paceibacterota bacterium]